MSAMGANMSCGTAPLFLPTLPQIPALLRQTHWRNYITGTVKNLTAPRLVKQPMV